MSQICRSVVLSTCFSFCFSVAVVSVAVVSVVSAGVSVASDVAVCVNLSGTGLGVLGIVPAFPPRLKTRSR